MWNPLAASASHDIALMDVVTGLFGRLEFVSSGMMSVSKVSEFSRLARHAVEVTLKNQNPIDSRRNPDDGPHQSESGLLSPIENIQADLNSAFPGPEGRVNTSDGCSPPQDRSRNGHWHLPESELAADMELLQDIDWNIMSTNGFAGIDFDFRENPLYINAVVGVSGMAN
jgi:hypothetical protein